MYLLTYLLTYETRMSEVNIEIMFRDNVLRDGRNRNAFACGAWTITNACVAVTDTDSGNSSTTPAVQYCVETPWYHLFYVRVRTTWYQEETAADADSRDVTSCTIMKH